jgi:hypothetical protein
MDMDMDIGSVPVFYTHNRRGAKLLLALTADTYVPVVVSPEQFRRRVVLIQLEGFSFCLGEYGSDVQYSRREYGLVKHPVCFFTVFDRSTLSIYENRNFAKSAAALTIRKHKNTTTPQP